MDSDFSEADIASMAMLTDSQQEKLMNMTESERDAVMREYLSPEQFEKYQRLPPAQKERYRWHKKYKQECSILPYVNNSFASF